LYSQHSPRDKYYFFTKQFDLPLSGFGTEDHNLHRLRRGVLNPFFSKQRIARLEPVIQTQVRRLCERILDFKEAGTPVPISLGFSCLTTDIITEYVMTQSFHYLDEPDWLPQWPKTLQSTAEVGTMAKQLPGIIPLLKSLPESWIEAMNPGMGLFFKFTRRCEEQIKEIMQNKEEMKRIAQDKMSTQPTLFHEILDSKLPPEEKTSPRLGQELHAVVGAGTETTSGVMTQVLYYLLCNPEKLQRLKDEISKLEPDRNVEMKLKDLEQLPYLVCSRQLSS
jgi:cytochrome P450